MGGWQILIQQGPRAGLAFDLDKPIVTIGREVGNDIVIEDPQVSRHHARLAQQGAGFVIEDLGSTNGTAINGQRVTAARPINPGDTLALGDTIVLKVVGAAGETLVAHGQPQTLVAPASPPPSPQSFSAPPPPPPPPPPVGYGAPPPPPQKKGLSCWVWGCGCIVVILIIILLALLWLYFLAPPGVTQPIIDFFKMFGINLV